MSWFRRREALTPKERALLERRQKLDTLLRKMEAQNRCQARRARLVAALMICLLGSLGAMLVLEWLH